MSQRNIPSPDHVKTEIEDRIDEDLDQSTWEDLMTTYSQKVGEYGDNEEFVAWVVAKLHFNVDVDSSFSLPGANQSNDDFGMPDESDLERVDLSSFTKDQMKGIDQIIISGFVTRIIEDTTSNNNLQRKVFMTDGTIEDGQILFVSGDQKVESWEEANIETGDWITLRGCEWFSLDDGDSDPLVAPSFTPWTEIEFTEPNRDKMKNFKRADIVNEGDMVYVEGGVVTDHNIYQYEGCDRCMTKWDDDTPTCHNCGHTESTEYHPGSFNVMAGSKTPEVSLGPADDWPRDPDSDDPEEGMVLLGADEDLTVYGRWDVTESDGEKYRQINYVSHEINDEEADHNPLQPDIDEDVEEDVVEEFEFEDEMEAAVDAMKDLAVADTPIPAKAAVRSINQEGVDDDESIAQIFLEMDDQEGITIESEKFDLEDITEEDDRDAEWREVNIILSEEMIRN